MGRIIPYIMENKKCLKPPTRILWFARRGHIPWSKFLNTVAKYNHITYNLPATFMGSIPSFSIFRSTPDSKATSHMGSYPKAVTVPMKHIDKIIPCYSSCNIPNNRTTPKEVEL